LPGIFKEYVNGKKAVDFGCGTGRSTRFLRQHGFSPIGIDISAEMIALAQRSDPKGKYILIKDGDYNALSSGSFDLVLSAFTFDNIKIENKPTLLTGLAQLLKEDGIFVNLVSSPEMYTYEWASFSNKEFPENKNAKSGDVVPIVTTDFEDNRPCYDIFCSGEDYKKMFSEYGFVLLNVLKPLATGDEPYNWVNETRIAPWTIYVLKRKD
jgi:SAM-dependent methyltransferase